jgi:Tfp pilus assembly protein PilO
MSAANRIIVVMLVVVSLAAAFWVLLLGPKRQQAGDLADEVEGAQASLAQSQSQAAEAAAARRGFPSDYQQLVVLGKAVPESDDTSSLLVELNNISGHSKVRFDGITIGESAGSTTSNLSPTPAPATPAPTTPPSGATAAGDSTAVPAAATVAPTETAAALLPIGATIGTAGLGVMPYDLSFSGDFFHVADFISGIDAMVHTKGSHVAVDGRLLTLDGFALNGDPELGFPHLNANFAVTTYVTPAGQGITAGASPSGPPATSGAATPASTTPTTPSGAAATAATAANTEAGTR